MSIEKLESLEAEVARLKKIMEGMDAPLTDMIYGRKSEELKDPTDVMPQNTGELNGVTDPLQNLINRFEPSELVSRQVFRKMLLGALNGWRDKSRLEAVAQYLHETEHLLISREMAEETRVYDLCVNHAQLLQERKDERV